ncbi:hypothetical protein [Croceibacterium ferulae]|uniref:hypothetical protein n=1 Tax=Croceibacterium ferulae TaxID=1854641 RepID=UPI000EAF2389|nr:hypothetical protein [Croceibacterium ferulae]
MKRKGDLLQVFGIPLLLAICSLVGLVSALTGDGWRDIVAWIALAVPVLAVGRAIQRRHA